MCTFNIECLYSDRHPLFQKFFRTVTKTLLTVSCFQMYRVCRRCSHIVSVQVDGVVCLHLQAWSQEQWLVEKLKGRESRGPGAAPGPPPTGSNLGHCPQLRSACVFK